MDIAEIQVESDQNAALTPAPGSDNRVIVSRQVFAGNGVRVKSCLFQDGSVFEREILVDFELQALVSRGRSTTPSRVSSAA